MKNKIYQNLDRVNDEAENYLLGLKYASKFLNSSIILKDAELTAMAYDHMSHFYLHLNMIDSANHTRKLALSKLDLVSDECKSYILANLAFSFSEHADKMLVLSGPRRLRTVGFSGAGHASGTPVLQPSQALSCCSSPMIPIYIQV